MPKSKNPKNATAMNIYDADKFLIKPAPSDESIVEGGHLIDYDGTTVLIADATMSTIYLQNLGPLKPINGRYYPVVYRKEFPMADTTQTPAQYFYEFCSRCPHKGFVHYDLIRPAQIDAISRILKAHPPQAVELYVHPQPELIKLLEKRKINYIVK